jgi:hypothetical protein
LSRPIIARSHRGWRRGDRITVRQKTQTTSATKSALRVISRRRAISIAFGAKRTSNRFYEYTA